MKMRSQLLHIYYISIYLEYLQLPQSHLYYIILQQKISTLYQISWIWVFYVELHKHIIKIFTAKITIFMCVVYFASVVFLQGEYVCAHLHWT